MSTALGQFNIGSGGSSLTTSPGPSGLPFAPQSGFIGTLFQRMIDAQDTNKKMKNRAFEQTMAERQQELNAKTQASDEAAKQGVDADNARKWATIHADEDRAALTAPIPKKLISGPGIIPGYVDDPGQMSALQRHAMLPGSAGMLPSKDPTTAGEDVTADDMMQHLYGSGGPSTSDTDPIQDAQYWKANNAGMGG